MAVIMPTGISVGAIMVRANVSQMIRKLAPKNTKESQEFREYGVGAQILRDLGVRKMILLTNSKRAIIGLEGFDLKIVRTQGIT